MADIDPQADIELRSADGHVTVKVPLAGAVTGEWVRCYQKLALATKVPVQAQAGHDRAWIVVSVPVSSDHGEVAATMDAAHAPIVEADAVAERSLPLPSSTGCLTEADLHRASRLRPSSPTSPSLPSSTRG